MSFFKLIPATVDKNYGRFIVRGDSSVTPGEQAETRRLALIEPPALADAEAFDHSVGYIAAHRLHEGIGSFESAATEGGG